MSVGKAGFYPTTGARDGLWKPVTSGKNATSTPHTPSSSTVAAVTDRVSVSSLADSLAGKAAKLFQQLDSKARGQLQSFVDAGTVKADDVVKGLDYLARSKAADASRKSAQSQDFQLGDGLSDLQREHWNKMVDLDNQLRDGRISQSEYETENEKEDKRAQQANKDAPPEARVADTRGFFTGTSIKLPDDWRDHVVTGDKLQNFTGSRPTESPDEGYKAYQSLLKAGFDPSSLR